MDNHFLLMIVYGMLEIMILSILIGHMIRFSFVLESIIIYGMGILMMLTMIYRAYLTFPNVVIFSLPLVGVFVASIVNESNALSNDETNLIYISGMMVVSLILTGIIGLVSPRILLKQVASQYGTFFVLMLTLFGTILIKYLVPVILYKSYPQLSPDFIKSTIHKNLTQLMMSKGFGAKLTRNEGIRQLMELVSESDLTNSISNEFSKLYDYVTAYVVIVSTNVTVISMMLKHRGRVGLSMIKDTLIDEMTYEQLQKLAVQGDDQYVNAIWTSKHARDTINEHEMKLNSHG